MGEGFAQSRIQFPQRHLNRRMRARINLINLRIIGNRLQCHMRHRLINKPRLQTLVRILQFVVVIARRHQPLLGQRHRHARGVARDPAAAPFFGDESGGAGTASGVEHEVAGVGGHQHAAL